MKTEDELSVLLEIDRIPIKPELFVTIVEDGFVQLPDNVLEYLHQLGVAPKLESNGKMKHEDYKLMNYHYGLDTPGSDKIITFVEEKTYQ